MPKVAKKAVNNQSQKSAKLTMRAGSHSKKLTSPDIISRITSLRKKMTRGEMRIANTILTDLEFAVHATTGELAHKAKVSLPTVSRFCRMVGCKSMLDFKVSLAKTLALGTRYLTPSVSNLREIGNPASQVLSSIHEALELLSQQLDAQKLKRAAKTLMHADRVFVFSGGGGGSAIAQDTEYRLFRLGISVNCCNDSQLQQMMAATLTNKDVLFIISTGGRYLELIKAAEIARQYDAKVIALTAPGTPLADVTNVTLDLHIPESDDILRPTASRYALLATIDILANMVAIEIGEPAREKLRRIKYQLVTLCDGTDRQPLGD